jgi:CRP-like cAMP-binding protein
MGMGSTVKINKGEWLFEQDEFADTLFIIQQGQFSMVKQFRENLEDKLPALGPGEILGWSALVPPHFYTLGAIADTESLVLAFDGKRLLDIMENDKEIGYYVFKDISELIGVRLSDICTQFMSMRV